jgi:hypothetical protein
LASLRIREIYLLHADFCRFSPLFHTKKSVNHYGLLVNFLLAFANAISIQAYGISFWQAQRANRKTTSDAATNQTGMPDA